VKQSFVHPGFNLKSADHDLALLILSSPVVLDFNVKTIKVNPYNDPVPGSLITLTGWGQTSNDGTISENLLKAEFTVMDKVACAQIYADLRPLTDNMFCANSPEYSICKVSIY
jgi:trypsin